MDYHLYVPFLPSWGAGGKHHSKLYSYTPCACPFTGEDCMGHTIILYAPLTETTSSHTATV